MMIEADELSTPNEVMRLSKSMAAAAKSGEPMQALPRRSSSYGAGITPTVSLGALSSALTVKVEPNTPFTFCRLILPLRAEVPSTLLLSQTHIASIACQTLELRS